MGGVLGGELPQSRTKRCGGVWRVGVGGEGGWGRGGGGGGGAAGGRGAAMWQPAVPYSCNGWRLGLL